nr:MAG TPA: hypothetical protein [Caudoviricetes sp.]
MPKKAIFFLVNRLIFMKGQNSPIFVIFINIL